MPWRRRPRWARRRGHSDLVLGLDGFLSLVDRLLDRRERHRGLDEVDANVVAEDLHESVHADVVRLEAIRVTVLTSSALEGVARTAASLAVNCGIGCSFRWSGSFRARPTRSPVIGPVRVPSGMMSKGQGLRLVALRPTTRAHGTRTDGIASWEIPSARGCGPHRPGSGPTSPRAAARCAAAAPPSSSELHLPRADRQELTGPRPRACASSPRRDPRAFRSRARPAPSAPAAGPCNPRMAPRAARPPRPARRAATRADGAR